jgi:hypothetical protein
MRLGRRAINPSDANVVPLPVHETPPGRSGVQRFATVVATWSLRCQCLHAHFTPICTLPLTPTCEMI